MNRHCINLFIFFNFALHSSVCMLIDTRKKQTLTCSFKLKISIMTTNMANKRKLDACPPNHFDDEDDDAISISSESSQSSSDAESSDADQRVQTSRLPKRMHVSFSDQQVVSSSVDNRCSRSAKTSVRMTTTNREEKERKKSSKSLSKLVINKSCPYDWRSFF